MKPTIAPADQPVALLPEYVAKQPTTLHMRGYLSWGKHVSGSDFCIKDITLGQQPREVFTTDASTWSVKEKRVLLNAARMPVFQLQRKIMAMRSTWLLMLPDQTPENAAVKFVAHVRFKDKIDVHVTLRDGSSLHLRVKGENWMKTRTNVYLGGSDVLLVHAEKKYWSWTIDWTLYVAEGMDMALVSLIC